MPDAVLIRDHPLADLASAALPCPAAALRTLPHDAKFILRARAEGLEIAGKAFGIDLPETACSAAPFGDRAALWLGPDECLLIAPESEGDLVVSSLANALREHPHSLVAVGHRNTALEISGPRAATVLNAGCPLDLDLAAFPVDMCTRTLLGKAEIVLWRTAPEVFRIEIWRSFAAYAWRFLDEARGEFR